MGEPGEYRKLRVPTYAPRLVRETAEGKYWRRFRSPKLFQQVAGVTYVDVCPTAPHYFAATSSTRVLLYDAASSRRLKQFTRFRETAYSGVFRHDGEALAAAGEDGRLQLFDAASRSVLRTYEGHVRAVHALRWAVGSKSRLGSGGDDATVRLWDVATGAQLARLDGHTDYVRALAASPTGELWASGGYDHSVCLWDPRAPHGQPARRLEHGQQVEDVAFFPSASLLASAGGDCVCVWDVLSGRLLRRLRPHAKAITCVKVYSDVGPAAALDGLADDGDGGRAPARAGTPRMLTASLDGTVKVFELDSFGVTHGSRFAGPVLSLALAPGADALAVGLASGGLVLRRRMRPKTDADGGAAGALPPPSLGTAAAAGLQLPRSGRRLDAGSYRYFIRGQSSRAAAGDAVAARRARARLAPYDGLLRRFRHREALDAALATRRPAVAAAVLDALVTRGALGGALAGRDAAALLPLLELLAGRCGDPRYAPLLLGVASRLLDIYTGAVGADSAVDAALARLAAALREEVRAQQELAGLLGALEPLLAASLRGTGGRVA